LSSISEAAIFVFSAAAMRTGDARKRLRQARGTADKELFDVGLGGAGFAAYRVTIDWGIAPPRTVRPSSWAMRSKTPSHMQAAVFFDGQEAHGDAIGPTQATACRAGCIRAQKGVGNLNQDSGASPVSGSQPAARW